MNTADRPSTSFVLNKLRNAPRNSAAEITPWFLEYMPELYFRTRTLDGRLRWDTVLLAPQPLPDKRGPALSQALATMREHRHTPPLWPRGWPQDQEKALALFLAGLDRGRIQERDAIARIPRHIGRKFLTSEALGLT